MLNRTIEQWLHEAIVEESYRRFDDLHVDEMDPPVRDRSQWLTGIKSALDSAVRIRDQRQWPFTLAAGLSLTSANAPSGPSLSRPNELVAQIDETPPSLYAFPNGAEPWNTNPTGYTELKPTVVGVGPNARVLFAEEFNEDDREYRRTVWISR